MRLLYIPEGNELIPAVDIRRHAYTHCRNDTDNNCNYKVIINRCSSCAVGCVHLSVMWTKKYTNLRRRVGAGIIFEAASIVSDLARCTHHRCSCRYVFRKPVRASFDFATPRVETESTNSSVPSTQMSRSRSNALIVISTTTPIKKVIISNTILSTDFEWSR